MKKLTVEIINGIDIQKLSKLLFYSNKYEINIQFWPEQTAVYIAKGGIDLIDFGGDAEFAINKSLEYLNRITKTKPKWKSQTRQD